MAQRHCRRTTCPAHCSSPRPPPIWAAAVKTEAHWKRVGMRPHNGIAIALASLRSRKSCGIGEFLDLIPLIDWCHSVGLDVIQMLPLYDTGDDPSPYNPLSSCALDPIYLSLADLPDLNDLADDLKVFAPLTEQQHIPWHQVKQQKTEWLTRYFLHRFEEVYLQPSYQKFLHDNPWVRTYALFKAHKDEYGGKHWKHWPEAAQAPHFGDMEEKRESVDFHCFLQYLCFQQLRQVHDHANHKKVFLKGDIPISLSPDSADVWSESHLFDLNFASGAPPDAYNREGQWWGFPLFNWDAMRADGFAWWKRRLKLLENFFHLYRIDHVVGYFRIWAIPPGKKAKEGHFIPLDEKKWEAQGREILEMMIRTSLLLPLAEDLGTIPKYVPLILKELGICTTKVLRWQRKEREKTYISIDKYEPLSITTIATADLEPLVLWWKTFPDEARPLAHSKQWNYKPELTFDQHLEILRDTYHTASLFHINLLQDALSLFPELVWSNPAEERINIPGTVLPTNWTYRYRPYLEELVTHQKLFDAFRKILFS
ncbi:MAG: 4-alpha-glucanotransferase [Verrucomicrobiota bacterium]|nr:4-alpha-glucanotransferase [Verrucomicrobiota bacterium]